jgi:predicted metal-dependent HD superfamily phosphohydrolase
MESTALDALRREWLRLLTALGATEGPAEQAFADLARHYAEPGRHYHTLEHVRDVHEVVCFLLDPPPPAVELAAFLHDVIYDSRAADNEERSAEHARELLRGLGVPADVGEQTARLIRLTSAHEAAEDDEAGCALLDADLLILSASTASYDAYAAAIREEYRWVPEEKYRIGRRRVLERFLSRAHIYHTPAVEEAFSERARANLAREIASLDGS